jgi:hypothetical protein
MAPRTLQREAAPPSNESASVVVLALIWINSGDDGPADCSGDPINAL